MKTSALVAILVIFALITGGGYFLTSSSTEESLICTADAKMCPDGSFVSRIGPNCEFAECSAESNSPGENTDTRNGVVLETRVNQGASGLDVKVIPIEVIEDSRCPIGVQCVWAGTVKVRVQLISGMGTSEQVFELNAPITTESEIVELIAVEPTPYAGVEISQSEYRFTFKVTKR
ncbi:MAG TPA: hypothetical protein VJB97_03120 [Candidatus Paceibacterota bacterium]